MTFRTIFTCLLLAAPLGCSSESLPDPSDGEAMSAPDGNGVCCPVSDFNGCSPFAEPAGGWAASADECGTVSWFDGCPVEREVDEHGCVAIVDVFPNCDSPCGMAPVDAGP